MAIFVINEWLWAHLSGGEGIDLQRRAFHVIESLSKSEHLIVVVEGSAWDQKAWQLCKYTSPMIVQRMMGVFVANIRVSPERCRILRSDLLSALPADLAQAVKDDDHYLVQAQRFVPGSIIVSTDGPPREAIGRFGLSGISPEEFLAQYIRVE